MKYVNFLSFDKDSMAQTLLLNKAGAPIDETVYIDIMFNDEISAEHPKKAAWIPKAEEKLKNEYGITVKHIKPKYTFVEYFYRVKQEGDHIGEIYGFPFTVGSWCNSRLKLDTTARYLTQTARGDSVTQYVGIAFDEPTRWKSLKAKETKRLKYCSPLYNQLMIEKEAYKLSADANLLSPKYEGGGFRGGCWFCVKQSLADIYELWSEYPAYFELLVKLEKDSRCTFNRHYSLTELNARFMRGDIPRRRSKNGK